jgi:FeS assembly SUF system regulator
MIRLTKMTDYAIVLMAEIAGQRDEDTLNARDLASASGVPLPMVSKTLKALAKGGLLVSHRGTKGGYELSKAPESITVVDIIEALEGPISLTECVGSDGVPCMIQSGCRTRHNWARISHEIRNALQNITLLEMTHGTASSLPPVRTNRQPIASNLID